MTTEEFNTCVDLYSDSLYRFILKNIKDQEKSMDIVQDTFEKVWIKVSVVEFNKAKSYIYTTGYRKMIDQIRYDKKYGEWQDLEEFLPVKENSFHDLKSIIGKALATLNEVQRSVITLRDYEGYSYEEISNITGLSLSQVKVYIFRGRQTLKEYLGSLENIL